MSQTSQHDAAQGEIDPGFFTAGEQFIVLGQSTPGGEPGERSLDNPSPFEHVEPLGPDLLPIHFSPLRDPDASQATPRVFDDLDLPAQRGLDPLDKAAFVVSAISPDQLEPRETPLEGSEQVFAPVMVLKTGLVYQLVHDQAVGIHQDMALATFDLLASVVAAPPPFWLVFTDWLSIIAALGVGSRPCLIRTCSRNAVCMRSQVPSVRHVRK